MISLHDIFLIFRTWNITRFFFFFRKPPSALPIIRRPQIFFDESEKNSGNSYRDSDASDIGSHSSRSSLYAKPVKYSNVKDKIGHGMLGQTSNKTAVGRGALLHANRIPKSKGRGSGITLLQNFRQPNVDSVSNYQQSMKSLGRGQLMETAMKLKNSSRWNGRYSQAWTKN